MLGIRVGRLRSCVEGVPVAMVLVAVHTYTHRRKPEGNEGEEKKVAAKEGCRQSGGYSYESMKDREHARRNLNNSCDTIPPPPLSPAAEYAVVTCRGGVNTRAEHSFRTSANISSPTAETCRSRSSLRHTQTLSDRRDLGVFPEVTFEEEASCPGEPVLALSAVPELRHDSVEKEMEGILAQGKLRVLASIRRNLNNLIDLYRRRSEDGTLQPVDLLTSPILAQTTSARTNARFRNGAERSGAERSAWVPLALEHRSAEVPRLISPVEYFRRVTSREPVWPAASLSAEL
ncbi:hypothetical protein ALC56_12130 [Trachymyrmex septentrionalis]|uniref:Uncharacterized protein n=1 Tax=Trachymyrmex septentrionalis TaxID=34720 RepID=A0A195EYX1_9HYME|nr:hypothetical protein ALC56_12130 [Trachymyrmex septentrionalis]